MGCHGAFNGLAVLAGLARLHPGEPLLLCATELCSLHAGANADGGAQVADALFGDGAAAVVARHAPALPAAGALVPRPELAARPWRLLDCACSLLPGGRHDLTWNLGERGFVMGLTAGLPERLARHLPDWLGAWLDRNGLSVEAVPSWALHPGGPRILDAVCAALGLPAAAAAASREVLAEFGNMSSPTVLFVLQRLARAGAPRPCVALGFGPGPVAEAALFG
jgi:predicted naringenin-chalcone synthase